MIALKFSLLLYTTVIFIILVFHPLSPVVCFNHKQPSGITRGLPFEEKKRLGSTPPSCHNKCNQCHPCMAVQIPSQRSHNQLQTAGINRVNQNEYFDSSSKLPLSTASNYKYSNYKPLGWKCSCGDHFFNP